MEPTDDYAKDGRLIFFRLDAIEARDEAVTRELELRKQEADKAKRDLDVAHGRIRASKLRLWLLILTALCPLLLELAKQWKGH
jgi:hypothetical protein